MHIGAVILAAGSASRFGSPKQLLALNGMPMIRRVATTALQASLNPVVVVVGAHGESVADSLRGLDVLIVDNAAWGSGMGSSLSLGVASLMTTSASLDAVMVLLGDQPAITATDLIDMCHRHARSPDRILASNYDGHPGPPCLFPVAYAPQLAALQGTQGARPVLDAHASHVDLVDLAAARFDIDTPADHAFWLANESIKTRDPDT